MKRDRGSVSVGTFRVVLLGFGALFPVGCFSAGEASGNEDNDENGGSSGGGTSGTGGSNSTGGASSGSSCVALCQRQQACPGSAEIDCTESCSASEGAARAAGCLVEYESIAACVLSHDACNPEAALCASELDAWAACTSGDPGGGGCAASGTAPPSSDCVTACERAQSCPDAEPTDCATTCSENVALVAMTGCTAQYQRAVGCSLSCMNVCNVSATDCDLELGQFTNCVVTYCAANPMATPCL